MIVLFDAGILIKLVSPQTPGEQQQKFDEKAAIECAFSIREALRSHDKKAPQINSPWQKVKFDHQIVAIAKSKGAGVIYSEDAGLRKFAQSAGVAALCIADLN
jgi:predicted nucleic acid-binding protein